MSSFKRFLLTSLKWGGGLLALYIGSLFISGLDFESRVGWFVVGLALAIAYVDGSLKDRITNLEIKVESFRRRLDGH